MNKLYIYKMTTQEEILNDICKLIIDANFADEFMSFYEKYSAKIYFDSSSYLRPECLYQIILIGYNKQYNGEKIIFPDNIIFSIPKLINAHHTLVAHDRIRKNRRIPTSSTYIIKMIYDSLCSNCSLIKPSS